MSSVPSQTSAAPETPATSVARLGLAAFLVMLPVTIIVPSLKELVGDRFGASDFWTHSFMSVNLLGAILATPLIAARCNHAGSRVRVGWTALLAEAALMAAMAVAPSLWAILALRFVEGVMHMTALTAVMALAADEPRVERRGRTMGLLGACMMFGTAAGTRLGGWVWRSWPDGTFQAAAVLCIVAAGVVAFLLRDQAHRTARPRLGESLLMLVRHRALLVSFSYTFMERFCVGVTISTFVLFLADGHGASPDQRSLLLVLFLLPFAALVYPAGRLVDRIGPLPALMTGSIGFGLVFAALAVIPTNGLAVAMLACGVLSALMFAPTLTLCAELAPAGQRGAAFAAFNAVGSLGFLAGPLVAGVVCHLAGPFGGTAAGYRAALVIAGLTELVVAVAAWPVLIRARAERGVCDAAAKG